MKTLALLILKVMVNVKYFEKVGQTSRPRSLGQKLWNAVKGIVTRNAYMQYESPSSTGLKVKEKVKVFEK